uniref:DUF7734 domain-containing protein n=1 Tax=Polyblepharides amylifera TaxID=1486889 RepID=A0A7R9SVJ5_9CHLO|mmetsp:Transcript_1161/g.1631  ORF Transcript_1161/g.1631 Transcript_1161/m.1631 type:complete len:195 (+) Transcript_1161:69-653(+)|eukprot:CAMPEP_0196583930 /NCGR_PEP_ID=MMETSP1081-20130531/45231_1 /TAXON_ID=36882 /ORGANISM="Pyramimonas amylifera, Strain CCMP720" /LENGTH=194 /DNA_ID=CAMNT_0041904969 /DNA_START=60 /DNA_END=644 /DNA_ORIENTATION=+
MNATISSVNFPKFQLKDDMKNYLKLNVSSIGSRKSVNCSNTFAGINGQFISAQHVIQINKRGMCKIAVMLQGNRPGKQCLGMCCSMANTTGSPVSPPEFLERLEAYTQDKVAEVVLVRAVVDGEEDEVLVFRGFSSSLVRPTPDDLGSPVLPAQACLLVSCDRLHAPYNPSSQDAIQANLTVEEMCEVLEGFGY